MFWLKLNIDVGYDKSFRMSDDWIHRAAKSAQGRKERNQLESEVQLHKAAIMTAKSPSLWLALVRSIEQAVRTFKEDIGEDDMLLAMGIQFLTMPEKIIVRTSRFPQMCMELQLDIAAQVIRYNFTRTQSSTAKPETWSDEYHLWVDSNDELCMIDMRRIPLTVAGVTKELLTKVFASFG